MLKSGALGTAARGTTVAHEDTIEAEVEGMPWVLAAVTIAGASR